MSLSIQWSQYIPHKPFPTQLSYLMLPHMDALFGGAAGGGKSDVLLMNALQYTHVPGYSAIILRRSLTELKQSGALLDRASKWLSNKKGVKFAADEHTYYFDTYYKDGRPGAPAKLQFGYLGDFRVEERYQGAEYQFIGIDEAGHFENDQAPRYLFSRLRKNVCEVHQLKKDHETGKMVANYVPGCEECDLQSSVPLKFRIACNPGGPGHLWIKQRYQITKQVVTDPKTKNKRVRFIGADPNKPFIPSSLYDNKFIDQSSYETALEELDAVRKAQLLAGDWDASPDARFNLEHARFYECRGEYYNLGGKVYHQDDFLKVFFTVDPAASTKAGPIDQSTTRKGKSFTVISVWGLTRDYQLIWMYMRRFRQEIPEVVDQLVDINNLYKPKYVKMETNGVGLGAAQLAMMRGVTIVKNPKAIDKIENAANAIYRMKNHRIWFPEQAPWLKEALDEVFTWTGHPSMTDDIVDTLSDACNDVTWTSQGQDPVFHKDENLIMPNNLPCIGAGPHSNSIRQYQQQAYLSYYERD